MGIRCNVKRYDSFWIRKTHTGKIRRGCEFENYEQRGTVHNSSAFEKAPEDQGQQNDQPKPLIGFELTQTVLGIIGTESRYLPP